MLRESLGLSLAAILVQASSLSWSGGPDRCMRRLDGEPLGRGQQRQIDIFAPGRQTLGRRQRRHHGDPVANYGVGNPQHVG